MTLTMKTLFLKLCTVAFVATSAVAATIHVVELYVISSSGFTVAYKVPEPKFAMQTDNSSNTVLGPSAGKSPEAIPNWLVRGEPAGAVIMINRALDDLIKQDKTIPKSCAELVDSRVDMIMYEGAAKPDISSPEALKRVLLHARPIAYSDSASGVYIEHELLKRPGIEEQVKAKAKTILHISVTSVVAIDDYEVGSQQVSELLSVSGATFVGKIPESLQLATYYATGIPVDTQHPGETKALLDYLASSAVQVDMKSTGLNFVFDQ